MKNNGNKKKAGQMNFKRKSIPMKIAIKRRFQHVKSRLRKKIIKTSNMVQDFL
jgi:hypothetical protein